MDANKFATSYMKVVLYLSDKNPVVAEHLLARFPHFLDMDQSMFLQVQKNTNKWLNKNLPSPKKINMMIGYDDFVNAVYTLAKVYSYGSSSIPQNIPRARKFIRILKLLKDERHQALQKEIMKQK